MRSPELGFFETRFKEVGSFEMRSPEVGSFEMRFTEAGSFEMRFTEVGSFEIDIRQGSISQVGPAQVKAPRSLLLSLPVLWATPPNYCKNSGHVCWRLLQPF